MQISANFDSGNIDVISAKDPSNIQLAIKKDNQSAFYQWFHFKLHHTEHVEHVMHLTNAGKSAYVDGWKDYQAVASYDRQHWFRVPTEFDGENLTITFTPEYDATYFAYFAPYSYERHQDLIHSAQLDIDCQLQVLGQTLDGRDMSVLKVGEEGEGKKVIWLTARQHPGESMAEWFMEGFIDRLLDEDDGVARSLLNSAVFYLVPNMNPDGSARGHLRTNAKGVNLNREWQTPTMENSPEVYLVREKMLATGVDMHLDIHGDEALPFNFVAGSEGVPSYNARIKGLEDKFKNVLLAITPEFQDDKGYDKDEPGQANLTVAANWVGEQFKCLAYTVEMPFKDNNLLPDYSVGWSDERSSLFGRDFLTAIYHVVDDLR
ncbi:carboxypeptidase family protein [Colwellia sp. MB02u-18]|uniref:M14 family metallopeptidase n=1 Tax=unclassified Colwellia TaxID=196834 RepID=UPI0015F6FE46|nr:MULTISPECIES: carboxypeptidase family protein [unclassified Colwellia]MBA6224716.1 carboxypeptidase family protein [Colwellia sp. MB3u-45]MBA6266832.1 carboxypeptidase family protein [Colwellia sp. MB3u-43]MBA6321427.1 carboxypeptidase family protein [Colwellia sp. MB02u-19]MBA6323634.1 carboxypeptidase family protein [Colwellia sp. MB02u-18]MBA6332455.1 carboxypeptidase family protein [Colwellia sp. MB02u-12]